MVWAELIEFEVRAREGVDKIARFRQRSMARDQLDGVFKSLVEGGLDFLDDIRRGSLANGKFFGFIHEPAEASYRDLQHASGCSSSVARFGRQEGEYPRGGWGSRVVSVFGLSHGFRERHGSLVMLGDSRLVELTKESGRCSL